MDTLLEDSLAQKIASHLERQIILNESNREKAKRLYMMKDFIRSEYFAKAEVLN